MWWHATKCKCPTQNQRLLLRYRILWQKSCFNDDYYCRSPGVVLNTPATRTINEPSLGMDLSRTTVHNTSAPPAYREVPQPIFNIQDEMTRNSNKGISQYYR